jgi:RNA polymerase sigma-70 factor (ECF subfamily)
MVRTWSRRLCSTRIAGWTPSTTAARSVPGYTLEEIADLVDSTPGGVKAALHRGREKLAAAPRLVVPRRAAVISGEARRLLQLYVERFNRRDWDGLRDLIAADATLRVRDRFEGPLGESPYFSRYARLPVPLTAMLSDLEGEPAIALYAHNGATEPRAFVRISIADSRIDGITDYSHCPWTIAAAEHVSPIPARA